MSILEQMVQLGMFAAGASVAEGLLRQALPKDLRGFFDRLTPIIKDGETRLSKPDLAPYYNRTAVDFGIPEVRQRAQLSPTSSTDVSEAEAEQ